MNLYDYVKTYAERGVCTCGKCYDGPENPEEEQPGGHSINLTFFKVAKKGGDKEEFLSLVNVEYSHWLDGKEHNYLEVGVDMGSQEIALMTIGLGHLLGVWEASSPDTIVPSLDNETKMKMAEIGLVTLWVQEKHQSI